MDDNTSETVVDDNSSGKPSISGSVIDDIRALLNANNDTSSFLGLALLESVLNKEPQLQEDGGQIIALWQAISPKFLDRLLRATQTERTSKEEADNMVDLAVAVLHTFAVLLPPDARDNKSFIGRSKHLVNTLVQSTPLRSKSILETLLSIVSCRSGALKFLEIDDLSPLTEMASSEPLVLEIIGRAWSNAATESSASGTLYESITKIMPILAVIFKDTDALTFLSFVADVLPKIPRDVLPQQPEWLQPLIMLVRRLVTSRPTAAGRAVYTESVAALLQAYPRRFPPLLFHDTQNSVEDSKPFSYLFINLLLIDLRSSFPTLLENLNNLEYPALSRRLGAAFDVISSFVGFLVRSLDDENFDEDISINIDPDLLLKLRKDIAETMSLTIEYLRDRWDASVAGAAGLHPSVRSGTAATSEGTRLTLTWDSMKDSVSADGLILAAIRALAIWLREDENESLRTESAGLSDMFVELYIASQSGLLDFRYPILTALEGIMLTENGVKGFLAQNGWQVLTEDLTSIVQQANEVGTINDSLEADVRRGVEVVRVLLAVIDHESTTQPEEEWMGMVNMAASIRHNPGALNIPVFELDTAILQLAAALLSLSPFGMQRRYLANTVAVTGLAEQLRSDVRQIIGPVRREFQESLDDVLLDLENLRH